MIRSRSIGGNTSKLTLAADGELRIKISDEADRMVLHEFIKALDATIPDRPLTLRGKVSKGLVGNLQSTLFSGSKSRTKHSQHVYYVSTGRLHSKFEEVES